MKTRLCAALFGGLMLMMALTGCGSEVAVTIPVQVSYPPDITSLQYTQDRTTQLVTGTISFTDRDADLYDMTIVVTNRLTGREASRTRTDLRSFSGYVSGTISFSIDYITMMAGIYDFTLYLSDSYGNLSNPVYGTFSVP